MKEYFSHDYHAKDDPKIIKLISKEGLEGYGLYWGIIEMLYIEGGFMELDCDSITTALRSHIKCDKIKRVIENYGLFKMAEGQFFSEGVLKRIALRKDLSEKNKENAKKRWDKFKENTKSLANTMGM